MIAKRAGLLLGAVLVAVLLLEAGTRALHRLREGEAFPARALRERLAPTEDLDRVIPADAPPNNPGGVQFGNKVLHPYLGYVLDLREDAASAINRFGLPGPDPLTAPSQNEVRIAITGGSVALQLFKNGSDELKQRLAASPAFTGKRIELVALTVAGYKQPQQLLALSWLLSLGAHFDLVINLDGFNEVVLPKAENTPLGVHPSFPRSWDLYQTKALDSDRAAHTAETLRLLERQRDLRRSLGTGLPSYSAFVLTTLSRLDTDLSEEIAALDAAFRKRRSLAGLGFQATGPFVPYSDDTVLLAELAVLWRNASLQMHHLTTAAGGRYFHFLQPNQWVIGAKPFSQIETSQLRVRSPFPPKDIVPTAYPLLAREAAQLDAAGVSFTSLVRLFREENRTVYRDTCCHFNRLGITAIADEIARVISSELQK